MTRRRLSLHTAGRFARWCYWAIYQRRRIPVPEYPLAVPVESGGPDPKTRTLTRIATSSRNHGNRVCSSITGTSITLRPATPSLSTLRTCPNFHEYVSARGHSSITFTVPLSSGGTQYVGSLHTRNEHDLLAEVSQVYGTWTVLPRRRHHGVRRARDDDRRGRGVQRRTSVRHSDLEARNLVPVLWCWISMSRASRGEGRWADWMFSRDVREWWMGVRVGRR